MSSNKANWNNKFKQGFFKPVNVEKYMGDPSNIKYRSSWEYVFANYLDMNPKILRWSCEQPIIMYQDLRYTTHRYYPDFYYEIMVNDNPNQYNRVIVEIKPSNELYPPERPKNETTKALENFEYAVRTHIKNKLKWSAAEEFARAYNMVFILLTEDHLKKMGLLRS